MIRSGLIRGNVFDWEMKVIYWYRLSDSTPRQPMRRSIWRKGTATPKKKKNKKGGGAGAAKKPNPGGGPSFRSPSGSASLTQLTQADTSGWYPRTTDPIPPARGAGGTTGEEEEEEEEEFIQNRTRVGRDS